MTRALALVTVVAAVAATACNTGYVPRTPGRIFMTMDGGIPSYYRDGHAYHHGFLGSGLQEAVRGNPQAEGAAREYHDRQRDGLIATFVGAVCTGTALGFAVSEAATSEANNHDHAIGRDLAISLGCMAVMFGGTIYIASAEPYRLDAINIFNDNPPPPPPGLYPGYGPGPGYGATTPVAPAEPRLGMR